MSCFWNALARARREIPAEAGPDVSLLGLSWLLAFDDGFADQVGELGRVFVVVPQGVEVAVL